MTAKVLYLHGWQSTPGGVKPSHLRRQGYEVIEPALPDEDFDEAVRLAQEALRTYAPNVVVGSSRGGAVAMNLDAPTTPLVLLCPAWKRWGRATRVKAGTLILHAPADDVIPYADSVELLQNSGLPSSALVSTGSDHRLSDPESLSVLAETVARLLRCHP